MSVDDLVLVTGAGGGLGNGLVKDLVSHGFKNVMCVCRSRTGDLQQTLADTDRAAWRVWKHTDLSRYDEVEAMRDAVKTLFGVPRAIINLAGSSSNGMAWKLEPDAFAKVMHDNVMSTFNVCHAFLPDMRRAGNGRIINTTSIVGFTGVAGASAYCASKAAVVGFTKSLSLEVANRGITVNALGLGYFDSGLIEQLTPEMKQDVVKRTPLNRLGKASDVGAAVRYLLSDDASFVTGQVLHVNGGLYL